MELEYAFMALRFLFSPLLIIGGIIYFIVRRKKKRGSSKSDPSAIAFSREDNVSQLMLLLSFLFMWVSMLAIDKQLGNPISWKTVLLIVTCITFYLLYRFKVLLALPFAIIAFKAWWLMQSFDLLSSSKSKGGGIMVYLGAALLTLLIYCAGRLHEFNAKWKRYALVYVVIGLIEITSVMFFLSTKIGMEGLASLSKNGMFSNTIFPAFSAVVFFLLLVGGSFLGFMKGILNKMDLAFIAAMAFLFIFTSFIPGGSLFVQQYRGGLYMPSSHQLSGFGMMAALIFNVFLLAELLGIVYLGYLRKETWMINLGSVGLFIFIFLKYIDWFFSFLNKSLFFIGAGILLFLVGWGMERTRKRMIASMDAGTVPENTVTYFEQ